MSGTASQYDIRYSTSAINNGNFSSATQVGSPPTPLVGGSFQSFVVTGLNSETTYYFAIKAADEVPNWSSLSNVVSVATSNDATPPTAIAGLDAILPSLNSLTLIWVASGDDGSVGTASVCDVRYSTSPITEGNWASATQLTGEPVPNPAGTPESLTVTGLAEATTYYFAIKTADERDNWSAISNIASNTTSLDTTPPSSINDLSALPGVNDGEINLSWTAPGDDGMVGRAIAYEIRYSPNEITEGNWMSAVPWVGSPPPANSGETESLTLGSLVPGDMYYVGIRAFDDAANSAALSNIAISEAKIVIILSNGNLAVPSAPAPMAVLATSQPMLVVENADADPSNVYFFEVATDTNFFVIIDAGQVAQEDGLTSSWKITVPLTNDQEYFWRVGTNNDGYTAVNSFFVEPFPHAYPNPVHFSKVDAATFTDLPVDGDLIVTSVTGSIIRQWSNLDGTDISWDGTNESGSRVASGMYLWYSSVNGSRGKLVVIN
jgi:chitodextrinase